MKRNEKTAKELLGISEKIQCNVTRYSSACKKNTVPYNRRDFYKIWLVAEKSKLHYADRSIEINSPALIFTNPLVPYSFESSAKKLEGYMCIFTEAFLKTESHMESLRQSTLFKPGSDKVFFLDKDQLATVINIYEDMLAEMQSVYAFKYDLIRNYIILLIHLSLKMQPSVSSIKYANASTRIATLFIELLERQFPIESPETQLKIKKPNDFAENLSVHINHLNRAVKDVTGKSTSVHISERIINEARALLKHTDWSVSEIAYCLGFEYATYFNNFFKKNTGLSPLSVRKAFV